MDLPQYQATLQNERHTERQTLTNVTMPMSASWVGAVAVLTGVLLPALRGGVAAEDEISIGDTCNSSVWFCEGACV